MTEEEKQEVIQAGRDNTFRANQSAFAHALDLEMQQAYKDRLADQIRELPWLKQYREEMQKEWNALPWYTKRYRRFKGWLYWTRRSVGEFIAGQKFNNE